MSKSIDSLVKEEFTQLSRIISELKDIEKRTERGVKVFKRIVKTLEKEGHLKKAKELSKEIKNLEKEASEEKKAEKLAQMVDKSLPKVLK